MPDHSRTFALITIRGLADMLADAADEIAARCPVAEKIAANNARPNPVTTRIPRNFDRIQTPEHFKRKAAETILWVRRNRLALKRMGRNHRASDARLLEKAATYRRDAQARLTIPTPLQSAAE